MRSSPASLLVIGSLLLDRLRFPGRRRALLQPGGNSLIFACTTAALGLPVVLAGRIGRDRAGRRLRTALRRHGVDCHLLRSPPGLITKRAEILVDEEGGWRTLASAPEVFPYLPDPEALGGLPAETTGLQVMGLNSLLRACPGPLRAWLVLARVARIPVGFGLNRLDPGEGAILDALIEPGDAVFCNLEELRDWRGLPPGSPPEEALRTAPGGEIVVSLGAGGLVARTAAGALLHMPAPAAQPCCTLGAGDILCAVTTALRRAGLPLDRALPLALEAATRSVADPGWDAWLSEDDGLTARLRTALGRPSPRTT